MCSHLTAIQIDPVHPSLCVESLGAQQAQLYATLLTAPEYVEHLGWSLCV
jgi:hypothetical protein